MTGMPNDSRPCLECAMQSINCSDSFYQDSEEPIALVILTILNKYYVPIIICVGIIGNALSAIVFLYTQLRRRSSSYYLAALAVSDLVFLVNLSLVYIDGLEIVQIHSRNIFCQCMTYLSSAASFLSTWLIVSFTVERFIAVQYPLQRPHICTVRRAKLTVVWLAVVALLSQSYILFMAGVTRVCDQSFCSIKPGYEDSMSILNTLDTIATNVLPVLLIVIMNTMIAVQLYRFSKMYHCPVQVPSRKKTTEESKHNQTKTSVTFSYGTNKSGHQKKPEANIFIHYIQQGSASSSSSSKILSQEMQYHITKMLLVISTVFIVLNCPSYVIRIYGYVWGDSDMERETFKLTQHYFMLLFYTHFSVNFLLYSTYGLTFRHALCAFVNELLCNCLKQQKVTFTMHKCMHVIQTGKSAQ